MYELKARRIPENQDYEVIVIGGGPSGCAAATASARKGAKTLLIEATGVLGGMGTTGLVPCFAPYANLREPGYEKVCGGIAWEVLRNLMERTPGYRQNPDDPKFLKDWVGIDCETLKLVYDELVENSGADILFHTRICGVDTDEAGTVTAVLVAGADGMTAYRANVYVDCTGNGLTAVWAGAEAQMGDEDGEVMPSTFCFTVGNVNECEYRLNKDWGWHFGSMHPVNPRSFIHRALKEGKYPLLDDPFYNDNPVGPALVGFNAGHIWGINSTDPVSISKGILKGRKKAWELMRVAQDYFPEAFAGAHMMATPNMIGHREGNRVKGDYELCVEDFIQRASFPDEIGKTPFEMDVHPPKNPKSAERLANLLGDNINPQPGNLGIPYRCLTPKGVKNVLVAGRAISCERLVLGCIRIMPICLVTGEAAGAAAAMASSMEECDVHQVDVEELRTYLKENGAIFN